MLKNSDYSFFYYIIYIKFQLIFFYNVLTNDIYLVNICARGYYVNPRKWRKKNAVRVIDSNR